MVDWLLKNLQNTTGLLFLPHPVVVVVVDGVVVGVAAAAAAAAVVINDCCCRHSATDMRVAVCRSLMRGKLLLANG